MPRRSVVQDDCFIRMPVVFGRIRRGKAPFYKRRPTHQRNIVEIDDLNQIATLVTFNDIVWS